VVFRFSRLGQRIAIPIVIAQDLNPYLIAGATILPAISYALLRYFYLMPRSQQKLIEWVNSKRFILVYADFSSRVKELRKENKELILRKREEALEACSVMERATAQRVEEERARQGGRTCLRVQRS
jgi:DnaJ family protein C protein 11